MRLGRNIFYNGFIFQPYIKGGIETQFSSGGRLEVADRVLRPNTDGNRAIFGAGVVWQMTEKAQIHLDCEGSFGDKYDVPWRVNAGFRYGF